MKRIAKCMPGSALSKTSATSSALSTETFRSPANRWSTSAAAVPAWPYLLRSTHSLSSRTVTGTKAARHRLPPSPRRPAPCRLRRAPGGNIRIRRLHRAASPPPGPRLPYPPGTRGAPSRATLPNTSSSRVSANAGTRFDNAPSSVFPAPRRTVPGSATQSLADTMAVNGSITTALRVGVDKVDSRQTLRRRGPRHAGQRPYLFTAELETTYFDVWRLLYRPICSILYALYKEEKFPNEILRVYFRCQT